MALTATANSRVKTDIIQNLGIANCIRFAQSFNRPNLRYYVLKKTKSIELDIVSFINSHYHGKSGIIYCLSKKDCELMAHNLQVKYRINAKYYHANLNPKDRHQVQKDWAENRVQVIVATIAFGMGIDKPDVRFVIHHSIPKSLEGYYQETGRAGRDGLDSTCVLYYSYGDKSTHDFLIDRGEGSAQQKQQQRDSLREVVQFCENRIDCRRQLVLQYFGENFDPLQCNKTCDNCENRSEVRMVDRSNEAKAVIGLLHGLGSGEKITLVQLIDVFRGSGAKKYAHFARNPNFGSGRDLTRTEAERLLQNMCAQNILQQFNVSNAMGYVSTYIRNGKDARDVERGLKKVVLAVDNSMSPPDLTDGFPAIQTTLPTRNKTLSKRKKQPPQPTADLVINSDPLFDDEDSEYLPSASPAKKTRTVNSKTKKPNSGKAKKERLSQEVILIEDDADSTQIPKSQTKKTQKEKSKSSTTAADLYNAVLKRREEICMRDKLSVARVMDNKTVKEISMAMPTSLTELARIKGIDDNKLVRYGPDIIDIVKRYKSV